MPKLSLEYIKDLCEIANYRNSLPERYIPYFDYWSGEIAAGRIRVSVPIIHTEEADLLLTGVYNGTVILNTLPMAENEIVAPEDQDVEVSIPEETEEVLIGENVEEETI